MVESNNGFLQIKFLKITKFEILIHLPGHSKCDDELSFQKYFGDFT